MAKARKQPADSTEQALIEWGAFMRAAADIKGFAAGESDYEQKGLYGALQDGGVGDPVLTALLALEASGNSRSHRIDVHLRGYSRSISREWYLIAWARFVGKPVATETKWIRQIASVQIGADCFRDMKMRVELPLRFTWSGMLSWDEVAEWTGIPKRSVEVMYSLIKRQLGMDMRMDNRVHRGRHLPDGAASAAERRSADNAREARENRARIDQEGEFVA